MQACDFSIQGTLSCKRTTEQIISPSLLLIMMDDVDEKSCPPGSFGITHPKLSSENAGYRQSLGNPYADNEDDDDEGIDNGGDNDIEDVDDDDDDYEGNGVQRIGKDDYESGDAVDCGDADADDDFGDMQKHPKKRKLKTLLSNYEFAPRVPAPPSALASASIPRPSYGGRNPLADWTERETFILLNAWGDRFLKQGRKSLRSEEWQEVAEKVSQESKIERTDTQCRNRLDTLKKKYKKENMKSGNGGCSASKWVYFTQMDELLSSSPQQGGLSCGLDSGEYVFMNTKVYLHQSNGLDEMRDSPADSESAGNEEDESEDTPTQITKKGASFKLLADSIYRFSEIYQKIENSKRQQMLELEKMRMDFHRDLELQKRKILERAQAQIQQIRQGDDDDDNEVSAGNVSG